ncbi:hypothetical protein JCM9743_21830 [Natrinema sp. JCM 9743]
MEAIWHVSQTFQSRIVNDRTRNRRRATVLSVVSMGGGVAAIAFRAVGGVLADMFSPPLMLALLAFVFVVGSGMLFTATPETVFRTTETDLSR